MALFENETLDEDYKSTNSYLEEPEKGFELLKSFLRGKKEELNIDRYENIIEETLYPMLAELNFENEVEILNEFIHIGEKLKEQNKFKALDGKNILGIGGSFSAGKSCFINSITNACLPESQMPTTSIATYVVNSDTKANIAFTSKGNKVCLNDEALQAISHEFYKKYNIGFARIIKNLVIQTEDFTYKNIAILDTPGYNKADTCKDKEVSDHEIAINQLKSVDYLIWLIDGEKGLTETDSEFISKINIKTPLLIVVTKASLRTTEALEQIISNVKDRLEDLNDILGIIAYDSLDKTTVIGGDTLERYMDFVNSDNGNYRDVESIIRSLCDNISRQMDKMMMDLKLHMKDCKKEILKTTDIFHCKSIIEEYSRTVGQIELILDWGKRYKVAEEELLSMLAEVEIE